uniref:Truncated sortase n=1 Tax=Streptococcus sobrinus TaxID=1310 RepID=B6EUV9_9STRE|nr:truncated sortase [Streptococcus sobrinus]
MKKRRRKRLMKKAKSRQSDFRTRKDSSKKKHHWFRTILVFLLLLVGLALVFNRSIRNSVIAWNTNKYQVSKVDKKTLTKNKKARLTMTLILLSRCQHNRLSAPRWMLKIYRLLAGLPFLIWNSTCLFLRD